VEHPFYIDAFLGRPLLARVAAAGPSVRPVWFLWEDGAFWWITGAYARLPKILTSNPRVALVVDSCDLRTGEVRQLTARGDAVVVHFDPERAPPQAGPLSRPQRGRLGSPLQRPLSQRP